MSEQNAESAVVVSMEDRVKQWPDQVLDCRDIGHAWHRDRIEFIEEEGIVERRWNCTRCTTVRVERIVRTTGEVFTRAYLYPAGYLTRGTGRVPRPVIRRESLGRVWDELQRKTA